MKTSKNSKTYSSTKKNEHSNRIVDELNATVATATFISTEGAQKADLYACRYSSDTLVAHGTCSPIHGVFVKTVLITFN